MVKTRITLIFVVLTLAICKQTKIEQKKKNRNKQATSLTFLQSQLDQKVHTFLENTYTQCSGNCLICNPSNQTICIQCQPSYLLTSNNSCTACPVGCQFCIGEQKCTQCYNGFILINQSSLSRCIACSKGCSTCQLMRISGGSNIETTTCIDCFMGFYLSSVINSSRQVCNPCVAGCIQCNNSGQCLKCVNRFGYNQSTNQCSPCQNNCVICSDQGCQQCELGFFLKSQPQQLTCSPCSDNCLQCLDQKLCQTCSKGYYPANSAGQQQNASTVCTACPNSCELCYNEKICLSCISGYFLNISEATQLNPDDNQTMIIVTSAICQPCMQNCEACYLGHQCQFCQTGYYLSSNKQCISCGKACHSCSGPNQCTQCIGSFYLSGGQCQACPQLCSLCQSALINNKTQPLCVSCYSFQYLPLNGRCVSCIETIQGCLTCTAINNCLSCIDGYYLSANGICNENNRLGAAYIVMIVIAGVIGIFAIVFGLWACWRHRNGYGLDSQQTTNPSLRASYYQIP